MNEQNLAKLRTLLLNEFDETELTALCQEIGLNYASLPGVGAYGKTREMVAAAHARQSVRALAARVRELRPEAYQATGIVMGDAPVEQISSERRTPREARREQAASAEPAPRARENTPRQSSALSPRARLIGVITAVVLLLVAVMALAQPRPATTPGVAVAPATATVAAPPATQQPGGAPSVTVVPTQTQMAIAQAVEDEYATSTATPLPTVTNTPPPIPTGTPTPEPTPTFSQTHPSAQMVRTANAQLLDFYQGKARVDDLRKYWNGEAYQMVLDFAYNTLQRKLAINLMKNEPIEVDLRYVRLPTLRSETGDKAQVNTREYWRYTNPLTRRSFCETRDYTYTLIKVNGQYEVSLINGKLVGTNCQN
jgi:hypothetical protein